MYFYWNNSLYAEGKGAQRDRGAARISATGQLRPNFLKGHWRPVTFPAFVVSAMGFIHNCTIVLPRFTFPPCRPFSLCWATACAL
jgi:hypothetical protein